VIGIYLGMGIYHFSGYSYDDSLVSGDAC